MGLYKILKIVAAILGVLGMVLWFMIVYKGDEAIKAAGGEGVDPLMYVGYIVLAIVLLFVLVFVLKGIFEGNIKKTLLSVGVFLLVVIISYVMATDSIEGLPLVDDEPITGSTSKWVGAGLYTFYLLAIAAIGAMVLSGVKKLTGK